MARRKNETYQDYRERVIDPISDSYCAAKWFNATIWMGAGMTASCHHPLPHKIDVDAIKANPRALHNTPHKKKMREMMLNGERPDECNYCWRVEDMKRDNVSDRVFKTVIYSDEDISKTVTTPVEEDVNLQTLEIAFDRTCQFACSYCNPSFSSTWVKDINKNGAYEGLTSDEFDHYTHAHGESQLFRYNQTNPFIKAFWEWWPELSKSLKELRVTGGEPTMAGDFWKLLDWFKDNVGSNIRFATNSNLGLKPDKLTKLIDRSKYIPDFQVYTSCEAVGAHSEYIRDGMDYKEWKGNVERLMREGKLSALNMMMTINALCLFSFTEFLDQMMEWKAEFGYNYPVFSVNILRYPSFHSALMLPDDMRAERKDAIQAWFDANKGNKLLHEFEATQLQRLIDYPDVVKTPYEGAADREHLQRDFKRFYTQYDQRRGKNFAETFPMLADWYKDIPNAD